MKIFFSLLLSIHGLIHLLGFVKAFNILAAKQGTQAISKPLGLLWLLAFIFFLLTLFQYVVNYNYWWVYGCMAVCISQALIIYFWQDAKFGTIANVIILAVSVIGCGTSIFYLSFQKDISRSLQQEEKKEAPILTELDILDLPEPVKKYIHYTGSIGKPAVHNFKIEFTGEIRKNEQSEWMPFTSEQYNFMKVPTRLFFMNAIMKHLPVNGYHCFRNGIAFMDIRLFSLIKVQYEKGQEMNIAETVTFFNDMCCMAPATLIDERIQWEYVDSHMVNATFSVDQITIQASLHFNDRGELVNFKSNNRYAADAGKKLPWQTPLSAYKEYEGFKLASKAQTIYTYPDRDLCYGSFSLTHIEYNFKTE